jgi:hypothetical protein
MDVEGRDGSVLHTLLVSDHILLEVSQKFCASQLILGVGLPGDRRFSAAQPSPGYVKSSIRVCKPLNDLTIPRKELTKNILLSLDRQREIGIKLNDRLGINSMRENAAVSSPFFLDPRAEIYSVGSFWRGRLVGSTKNFCQEIGSCRIV